MNEVKDSKMWKSRGQLKDFKKSEEMSEINTERLNQMLELLVQRLFDDHEFREFTGLFKDNIFQTMTLDMVKAKVVLKKYQTTTEFMDDIRMISIGQTFSANFNANRKKSLEKLQDFCKQEVNDISNCDYCYENAFIHNDWFSLVCPRRHPLAWVVCENNGTLYTPAKVMKYNSIKKSYIVYFFGDHENATIPSHYCLSFTEKSPNKIVTLQQRKDINAAMKEVFMYIENLKKSGSFTYATHREKFDQHTLFPRSQQNVTSTMSSVNVPNATNYVTLPMTLPSVSSTNRTSSTSVANMGNDTNCVSVPIIISPTPIRSVLSSNTNTISSTSSHSVISSNTNVIATKIENSSLIEAIAEDPGSVNSDAVELFKKILEGKDARLEILKKELTAIQEEEQMKDVHFHKLKNQLIAEKNKHVKERKRVREENDKKIDEIKKRVWCSECQNELSTINFCNQNCSSNWTKRQK